MNLHDLKNAYLSRHAMSLDDSATQHVRGFVAFLEEALAALVPAADGAPAVDEASAMPAVVAAVAPTEGGQPDPAVVAATETVVYPDGTSVTGPGPLPAESPADATPPADPPAA
jgi:hypothetical protein